MKGKDKINKPNSIIDHLPGFLASFVNATDQTSRGRAGVEVVKTDNQVVSATIRHQNIINFPQANNKQAMIVIAQRVADLETSGHEKESCNFRLEVKNGVITKMFITNEHSVDVGEVNHD